MTAESVFSLRRVSPLTLRFGSSIASGDGSARANQTIEPWTRTTAREREEQRLPYPLRTRGGSRSSTTFRS